MKYLNFSVDEEFFKRVKIDAIKKGYTTRQYLYEAVKVYLAQSEEKEKED